MIFSTLIALVLAQPTLGGGSQSVTITNPTNPTKRVTTTTSGGKELLDVNCPGCTGGGGSSGTDGGYTIVIQGPGSDGGADWAVHVNASALPAGASTETTLGLVKAKTDNLDVALSTRTKPADQQHVIVDSSASIAVTGPLTDTQLRASAVPVTANAGTNLNTSALALDATLTGGTEKAIVRGGAKGATAAADVTSTANGVDHQGLDVQLQNASVAITAAALPLPSGAATASNQTTLGSQTTKLNDGTDTALVSGSGSLQVTCDNCGGSTFSDNTAFTFGTTPVVNVGAVVDDVAPNAVSENSAGAPRMSTRREVYEQIRDASGAERGANVNASNALLTAQTGALPAGTNVIGHVINDTGSTTAVTGNVTVTQGTGTNLHAVIDTGSTTTVTGNVTTVQATAANLNAQVQGAGASGAAKAGNPVQVGGVFNTTQPTVTTGQGVEAQTTARGALIVASGVDAIAVNNTQQGTAAQNVTQFGGTNVSTGTGAGGAGIPRVTISNDSSLAANQSVNVSQINAVTPLMGNGTTGTGSQRVTIASDNTAFAVNAAATQSGTWTDRVVGNAGGVIDAANNGTAPANVWIDGWQLQTGATATAGTAGQVGSPVASLDHVPYSRLGGPVTWTCSLDNIGATLTQCQAVGGAGLKYYVTDIEIESTTATAGLFLVRTGTGSNCVTSTASLFPSAATVPRLSYPANTAANPSVFHFLTPLVSPAASEICIICTVTNTCTVQMTGYTAP